MNEEIRIKAIIKRHNKPDQTGMVHLCDSAYDEDEEKGREKRKRFFPVGREVQAKPAHWFGNLQVFTAINDNGDFDYFDHNEIRIIEKEKLFKHYPNAGYDSDKEYFNEYMKKFNDK